MASGAAKNKTLEEKNFFCARMTFSQSVMVADDALKWDYAAAWIHIPIYCSAFFVEFILLE